MLLLVDLLWLLNIDFSSSVVALLAAMLAAFAFAFLQQFYAACHYIIQFSDLCRSLPVSLTSSPALIKTPANQPEQCLIYQYFQRKRSTLRGLLSSSI